jgi:hypothetical protein
MTRYSLRCQCGERIPLPRRSPLGIFEGQVAEANLQRWPLRFVCQNCGLASVHEVQEIDQEERGRPDLFDSEHNLWHVQILCDHRQCGTHYTIYTQVPTNAGRDDVLYVLQHAKRPVTCGETDHVFDTTMVLHCGTACSGWRLVTPHHHSGQQHSNSVSSR